MTINQIIELLLNIRARHGDVLVYFDCPKCEMSFKPNKVVTLAAHITEKTK